MRIHILGICGTLMGSIALLARGLGHTVSGSDQNVYPPMSTQLQDAGITLASGYSADSIPADTELVIVGNAGLPRGNPAVEAMLDSGVPYTSGAEWLGRYALADRWVIAVAGTHGKTTTSSMIAWILDQAGLNPGFLIGGVPHNFGESARLGSTPFFVIEADEYDTSYFDRRSKFLHYRPRTAVLNNLEFDHADIFEDLAAIQAQFHLLLRSIPGSGLVIHPAQDDNLATVFRQGCWTERLSFGSNDADITARPIASDGSHFEVLIGGQHIGILQWQLTGEHNVNNALAAIAAARHAGVHPEVAIEALSTFTSVKRRMELIYDDGSTRVYDDFAHHPTAIKSTLEGLRNQVGDAAILAIIEPGSHTMRKGTHEHSLAESALAASDVVWFEPPTVGWDVRNLIVNNNVRVSGDHQEIINWATDYANQHQPCHIVIMSNSGFGGLHQQVVAALPGT